MNYLLNFFRQYQEHSLLMLRSKKVCYLIIIKLDVSMNIQLYQSIQTRLTHAIPVYIFNVSQRLFNNYVMLKLLILNSPTLHRNISSRMIVRRSLRYVTLDTDTAFYHLFLFVEDEKHPKDTHLHMRSTHVFKQLN